MGRFLVGFTAKFLSLSVCGSRHTNYFEANKWAWNMMFKLAYWFTFQAVLKSLFYISRFLQIRENNTVNCHLYDGWKFRSDASVLSRYTFVPVHSDLNLLLSLVRFSNIGIVTRKRWTAWWKRRSGSTWSGRFRSSPGPSTGMASLALTRCSRSMSSWKETRLGLTQMIQNDKFGWEKKTRQRWLMS